MLPADGEDEQRREEARAGHELIGIAARARFSALPAVETRPDAPVRDEAAALPHPREVGSVASENGLAGRDSAPRSGGDDDEVFGLVGRPGKGGRQVKDYSAQLTAESREILERLGEPYEHRTVAGGVVVLRFLVDPESDTVWFIRLSPTQQDKSQETAMEQYIAMEAECEAGRLRRPRWAVFTLNNSGSRRPHERYDLMLMREWIEEGWLRCVAWRNEKRLARQKFTLAWCEELLESSSTEIFFTEYHKAVDWDNSNDRTLFTIKSIFAAEDRRAIVDQTQKGLDRRYVDEGKGWPGLQQVGLRRDPVSGFMVEDELQTEMILRGALLFVSKSGIKSGVKWVAKGMKEKFGFELSPKQWERIFKNEGFVTGQFFFNRKGQPVPLREIELVNRIPPHVFQQIQEAFATNKGNTRSRPGDFVLLRAGAGQDVATEERGLMCKRCDEKLGAWLQGELNDTRYRHRSPVPECCHGWGGIERADLEEVVMRELWRLADVEELREAAVRAARLEDAPISAFLDATQRKQLRKDIDDLDREIARLGREYRREYLHNGKAARSRKNHIAAYAALVEGLEEDKRHLEARLKQADALEAIEKSLPPHVDVGLAEALREVLTVDVPVDDAACRRRAAVFGRLVTKVVVDKKADGSCEIEIYGPLVPRDLPALSVPAPVELVSDQLRMHQAEKTRAAGETPRGIRAFGDARRDLAARKELQVSSEGTPSDERCNRRFAWLARSRTQAPRI